MLAEVLMIYVVDLAGRPWKNDRESDDPIGHGDVLARNEWSTLKKMAVWMDIIICIATVAIFIVQTYIFSTPFDFMHPVMEHELLFGFFMFGSFICLTGWIFITIWRIPHYRFTVYANGFTYEYKLPGTDFLSNYMPYSNIHSVYFKKYGMRMVLVLKTDRRATIDISDDYKAYVTLMAKLKNIFHFNTYPDITAIINYKEANDQEASLESFYNERMCRRDLEMKNHQFA